MRFSSIAGAVLLPLASFVSGIQLKIDDEASIRDATKQYAFGLMSLYKNNGTNVAKEDIGIFPQPHYWWEAGAAWGGMIEYTQFTGDSSYVKTLTQALVANYGPNNDILLPWRKSQEGNDDQAFWALALMSALEYQFPEPAEATASYLEVVENSFNNIVSRWDTASCGGGLKWQIYPENAYGYNYKNSISNGAVFALGARLARYTGNQTYADWAVKIWDWSTAVNLVSDKYEVFDGSDDKKNCTEQDHTQWSYNIGVYLHGAAALYNHTKGDERWKKHTSGLLDHAATFFKPYNNATDIMYEVACETGETGRTCNLDQQSFKAYLSRFLAKTAIMAPFTKNTVTTWLQKSATAAAISCSGGATGVQCGSKWYTGGWDGTTGVGQQLSALEVTQALLTLKQGIVPRIKGESKPAQSPSSTPGANSSPATGSASSAGPPSISQTAVPSTLAATAKPSSSVAVTSSLPVVAPSSASTVPAGSLHGAPLASSVCTCTPSRTVTVYVPPVPTTSVPASAPVVPTTRPGPTNATAVPPPANTTGPLLFPGAASNNKATLLSILGAVIVAVFGGLL